MNSVLPLKWSRVLVSLRWRDEPAAWERRIALVFAVLLCCVALFFVWRRLSGALISALPAVLLITAGLLVAMMALGIRVLHRSTRLRRANLLANFLFDVLICASTMIFGAAVTLPESNGWAMLVFWLFLATGEFWAWRPWAGQTHWISRRGDKQNRLRPIRVDATHPTLLHPVATTNATAALDQFSTSVCAPAEHITQQLIRSVERDGSDVLSGWLRLSFTSGQRLGHIHLAFCPPFAQAPELTVSQLDGPQARIKVAQLLPYGVRLDLKLSAFSLEPTSVLLKFAARSVVEGAENS
ncbi:MAG: hypothetical protein ACWGMZ_05755 [Thermoguttaceae bacterium]